MADTDAVMESFYTYCHRAGPTLCPFHASYPSKIEARLDILLAKLKENPVIVPASTTNDRPEIITYSKVRKAIASALYCSLVIFPTLAESLAALEAGDGKPFLELTSQDQVDLPLCGSGTSQASGSATEIPGVGGSAGAPLAVLCSDQAQFEGGVKHSIIT